MVPGIWVSSVEFCMRCVAYTLIRELAKKSSSVCQYKLATKAPIILLSRSILSGSRLGKTNASTGTVIPPSVRIKRMSPNL